jgi:hypothetical protein
MSSFARTQAKKADKAAAVAPPSSPAPSRRDMKLLITPQHMKPPAEAKKATPKTSGKKAKKSIEEEEVEEGSDENVNTNANTSFEAEAGIVVLSPPGKSSLEITWRTEKAYKILRQTTGQLGGNGKYCQCTECLIANYQYCSI